MSSRTVMVDLYLMLQVVVGDAVSVCPEDPHVPLYIARIIFMWENNMGMKQFHAHWFRYCTAVDVILLFVRIMCLVVVDWIHCSGRLVTPVSYF